RHAPLGGGLLVPVREAVAAEAGKVHEVDVLHVGAVAEVLHQPPESRGFELRRQVLVELGHRLISILVSRQVLKRGMGRSGLGSGALATDGGSPTPHSPFPTPRCCEPDDAGILEGLLREVLKRGMGRSGLGSGALATDGGSPTPHSPFPTPRCCEPDDAGILEGLLRNAAHTLTPGLL